MKKIKFELTEESLSFCDPQHVIAEIFLNGETIGDYLQAFKAFLIACSFTEDLIATIQTEEQFYLNMSESYRDSQKDLTDSE